MRQEVLAGVRVLECTTAMAGPYATLQLGNLGAEVIKVEPPGGDGTRQWGPFVGEVSVPFLAVNRGKKSVMLDLTTKDGIADFRHLVQTTDVFVENMRPGTMRKFGLDYEALRRIRPSIIYCSISGYGQTGPYAERGGYDLIAQGVTGIMSVTGEPERPPVKAGIPVTDLGAALFATQGILAALLHRERSGEGQYIDTSLFDAGVALSVWEAHTYFATGNVPGPLGSANLLIAPYQAVRASDGYFTIGAGQQNLWERFCRAMGLEALLEEPAYASSSERRAHQAELIAAIEAVTRTQTRAFWLERLDRAGVPCGPINHIDEVMADPQTVARELVVTVHTEGGGEVRTLGSPLKMSATPPVIRGGSPRLGEHNAALLAEVGVEE